MNRWEDTDSGSIVAADTDADADADADDTANEQISICEDTEADAVTVADADADDTADEHELKVLAMRK